MFLRRPLRTHCLVILCAVVATTAQVAYGQLPGLSRLGGWVYIDRNNDGNLAFSNEPNPEYVIGDVQISLYSTVGNVETFVASTLSDDFGRYLFENILPATYTLRETPPIEYVDGIDTLGILQSLDGQPIPGNASVGVMTNNAFSQIVLPANVGGDFYNFGERGLAAGYVSKRFLFASFPPPPFTPPPPPFEPPPPGEPPLPEPTSLMLALAAGCGGYLATGRSRRR